MFESQLSQIPDQATVAICEGSVGDQIESLRATVESLDKSLDMLSAKLEPILGVVPPCEERVKSDKVARCKLAEIIRIVVDRISDESQRIESIVQRIEL